MVQVNLTVRRPCYHGTVEPNRQKNFAVMVQVNLSEDLAIMVQLNLS